MSRSTLYYLPGIRPTSKTSLRTGSKENNHQSWDFSCLQWYSECLPLFQHPRGANGGRKDSQETYLSFLAVRLTSSSLQLAFSKQIKVPPLLTINWKSSNLNPQVVTKDAAKLLISLEGEMLEKPNQRHCTRNLQSSLVKLRKESNHLKIVIQEHSQEHRHQQFFFKQQLLQWLKMAYVNDRNLRHHEGGRKNQKIIYSLCNRKLKQVLKIQKSDIECIQQRTS